MYQLIAQSSEMGLGGRNLQVSNGFFNSNVA